MFSKLLRATFVSLILSPMLLVAMHVLAFQLNFAHYGIYLSLYDGRELTIYEIVRWLLFMDEEAFVGANFASVLLSWLISWYVAADWVRDYRVILFTPFIVLFAGIFYFAAWSHAQILIYFPEILYVFVTAWVIEVLLYVKYRLRRPKTFFERLEEEGFEFPEEYKKLVKLPRKCPHCGSIQYSSSEFCWRCGRKVL
ncbi:MAG: hypothetical protein ACP6IP_06265 [Candidatus Njordarchaeia archaeon]